MARPFAVDISRLILPNFRIPRRKETRGLSGLIRSFQCLIIWTETAPHPDSPIMKARELKT